MKKITAIILALITITSCFLLTGCKKETDPIVGTWEARISHQDIPNITLGSVYDEFMVYDDVYKTIIFEFDENGYYTETIDIEGYIDAFIDAAKDGVDRYYEAQIADKKLNMTIEELMEEDGVEYDDFIDWNSIEELRKEDPVTEGKYLVKDNKLYLSSGKEYDVDENIYINISIKDDTLVFESQFGEFDFDTFSPLPLTFNRKK